MAQWATEGLESGEWEFAPHSKWASYPHIALKVKRGSANDADDFGIRLVGDYVSVNEETEPLQANAPNAPFD